MAQFLPMLGPTAVKEANKHKWHIVWIIVVLTVILFIFVIVRKAMSTLSKLNPLNVMNEKSNSKVDNLKYVAPLPYAIGKIFGR